MDKEEAILTLVAEITLIETKVKLMKAELEDLLLVVASLENTTDAVAKLLRRKK